MLTLHCLNLLKNHQPILADSIISVIDYTAKEIVLDYMGLHIHYSALQAVNVK